MIEVTVKIVFRDEKGQEVYEQTAKLLLHDGSIVEVSVPTKLRFDLVTPNGIKPFGVAETTGEPASIGEQDTRPPNEFGLY